MLKKVIAQKNGKTAVWSPGIGGRLVGLVMICALGMGAIGLAAHEASRRLGAHAEVIGNHQQMLMGLSRFGNAVSNAQLGFAAFLKDREGRDMEAVEKHLASAEAEIAKLHGAARTAEKQDQVAKLAQALRSIASAVSATLPQAQRSGPSSPGVLVADLNGASANLASLADTLAQRTTDTAALAASSQLYKALKTELVSRAAPDRLQALDMGYAIEDAKSALATVKGIGAPQVEILSAYEQAFSMWLDVAGNIASNAAVARDVFGILAPIIREAETASAAVAEGLLVEQKGILSSLALQLWLALGVVLLVTLGLAIAISRSVTTPIRQISDAMQRLSSGDVNSAIPHTQDANEIGSMARSISVFQNAMRERESLVSGQLTAAREQGARSRDLADAAVAFNTSIGAAQARVNAVSQGLDRFAQRLTAVSSHLDQQMRQAQDASDGTAARTGSVAAAADELAQSIAEISRQISAANDAVHDAASAGVAAEERMSTLQAAAGEIGAVVSLINEIAGRTNLLALNATIEAARAGASGRGFAVVAEEIKSLAGQTSGATGEISRLIAAIQGSASEGAGSVRALSDKLQSIQSSTATVAVAVTQQDASVGEIAAVANALSGNAQKASAASSAASSVSREAVDMAQGISNLAMELSEARRLFDAEAQRFVEIVRAA